MPDKHGGTLRQIAWHDVFPSLSLLRTVRLAAAPRLVLLAALGLAFTAGGWHAIGWVFSGSDDSAARSWMLDDQKLPWETRDDDAWQMLDARPLENDVIVARNSAMARVTRTVELHRTQLAQVRRSGSAGRSSESSIPRRA